MGSTNVTRRRLPTSKKVRSLSKLFSKVNWEATVLGMKNGKYKNSYKKHALKIKLTPGPVTPTTWKKHVKKCKEKKKKEREYKKRQKEHAAASRFILGRSTF